MKREKDFPLLANELEMAFIHLAIAEWMLLSS
jgi:hypothetical protein